MHFILLKLKLTSATLLDKPFAGLTFRKKEKESGNGKFPWF